MKMDLTRCEVISQPTQIFLDPRRLSSTSGTTAPSGSVTIHSPDNVLVLRYTRGGEMEIQAALSTLDALEPASVWLTAEEGINGGASLGFSRSLRREYLAWTIRIVVFDPTWSMSAIDAATQGMLSQPDFPLESFVDAEGHVLMTQIQHTAPPSSPLAFDAHVPWRLEGTQLHQSPIPAIPEQHVAAEVIGLEPLRVAGVWAFLGKTTHSSRRVVGVTSGPLSSHVVIHEDCVMEVDSSNQDALDAPSVLAATVLALAIGPWRFSHQKYLRATKVLITHKDTEMGSQLIQVCAAHDLAVTALSASPTPVELETCYQARPTVILSGAVDAGDVQVLRSLLASGGRLLLWNDVENGASSLVAGDPIVVGDAMRCAIAKEGSRQIRFAPLMELVPSASTLLVSDSLFDPHKSYLLIGGVGNLGAAIAHWMYEVRFYMLFTSDHSSDSCIWQP